MGQVYKTQSVQLICTYVERMRRMSENFSKRNGLVNAKLLIEDIPISVRASFAKEILAECYLT